MDTSVISVKGVSKAIGDRLLLSDVSFDVAKGSLVSLIGPNGAGKTTLLKIILGVDRHYSGTVSIRAQERVQYIPQMPGSSHQELPMSVREYLAIGATVLYSNTRRPMRFEEMLEHVGVSPLALNQSFAGLSGGERQRIAIARALLSEPTILILDEPLGAVDYASRQGLYELIRHLQQHHAMTVLMVSHDVESVLPLSDRVLCLNKTLHTDCHPSAFMKRDGTYAAIEHHC